MLKTLKKLLGKANKRAEKLFTKINNRNNKWKLNLSCVKSRFDSKNLIRQLSLPYEKMPAYKNLMRQKEACEMMDDMVNSALERANNQGRNGLFLDYVNNLINDINDESFYAWSFISENYNKFLLLTLKLTKHILEETNIGVTIDKFGQEIPVHLDFLNMKINVLSSFNVMLKNLHLKPTENQVRGIVSNQIEHFKNVLKNPNTCVRNLENDISTLDGFIKNLENNKK